MRCAKAVRDLRERRRAARGRDGVRSGRPRGPDDPLHRQLAGLAPVCHASGAALAVATLTCSLLGVISAQQAIAMALPAAVLIFGNLIAAAIPDPSISNRLGFQAGLRAGTLINQWRSHVRDRR